MNLRLYLLLFAVFLFSANVVAITNSCSLFAPVSNTFPSDPNYIEFSPDISDEFLIWNSYYNDVNHLPGTVNLWVSDLGNDKTFGTVDDGNIFIITDGIQWGQAKLTTIKNSGLPPSTIAAWINEDNSVAYCTMSAGSCIPNPSQSFVIVDSSSEFKHQLDLEKYTLGYIKQTNVSELSRNIVIRDIFTGESDEIVVDENFYPYIKVGDKLVAWEESSNNGNIWNRINLYDFARKVTIPLYDWQNVNLHVQDVVRYGRYSLILVRENLTIKYFIYDHRRGTVDNGHPIFTGQYITSASLDKKQPEVLLVKLDAPSTLPERLFSIKIRSLITNQISINSTESFGGFPIIGENQNTVYAENYPIEQYPYTNGLARVKIGLCS